MSTGTPAAERHIDAALVRRLLRDQHPDLADAGLRRIDAGWDNEIFRLGDQLMVRLPRRRLAVKFIEREQAWMPTLAPRLPLAVPSLVRKGQPSRRFPWPWSVVSWLPGRTADLEPPAPTQATVLADFLGALHRPAPSNAPVNDVRGVPLAQRAQAVEARLDRLRRSTDVVSTSIIDLWQRALAAPSATETRWVHGDLHARNVLVADGSLRAVIDWGDLTSGDIATDLASVWTLFDDADARRACLARYQPSAALAARAKGWAVFFAALLLDTGRVDRPAYADMGEAVFRRLHEDR